MSFSPVKFIYEPPKNLLFKIVTNGFKFQFYCIHEIWQVIHRTLAAMLAAFVSIGTLAAFQDRPTMGDIIKWIDYETLLLIFSMMILVAILIDTGIFDYIAVYTFQV